MAGYLGRFDLYAQVATMSRFRAAPRQCWIAQPNGSVTAPLSLEQQQG